MSDTRVRDLYNSAIKELRAVIANSETDEATREDATNKVGALRTKIQGAALDDITSRTPNLQVLIQEMQGIVDKASCAGTADCISGVKNLISRAKSLMDTFKGA